MQVHCKKAACMDYHLEAEDLLTLGVEERKVLVEICHHNHRNLTDSQYVNETDYCKLALTRKKNTGEIISISCCILLCITICYEINVKFS